MKSLCRKEKSMKIRVLIALSLLVLVAIATPAFAAPGKDPVDEQSWFAITFQDIPSGVKAERVDFNELKGWDFGDRAGYRCTWVEFFQGNDLKFIVAFDRVGDYTALKVNDRYGVEQSNTCAPGGDDGHAVIDGTDHMPHGATIEFYQNGQPIATLPLTKGVCDKFYFSPGDEPGEAWLWWDPDGPQDTDVGLGDCPGGSAEPVKVLRVHVTYADPDITYCTTNPRRPAICS